MPIPRPRNEEKRLEALRRFQIIDSPPEETFDDIVLIASTLCQTPIALITLLDEQRQWFKARLGLSETHTSRENAFCSYTIMGQDLMVVENAEEDARFSSNPLVTDDPHIRFYAGAPLIDSDGFALGSLCVIDREPRVLDDEKSKALKALSRQVISLIEYRRASIELASSLEQIQTLQRILPICGHCKKVRNDAGYWEGVENYFAEHSEVQLSHGICPSCAEEFFPQSKVREKKKASAKT